MGPRRAHRSPLAAGGLNRRERLRSRAEGKHAGAAPVPAARAPRGAREALRRAGAAAASHPSPRDTRPHPRRPAHRTPRCGGHHRSGRGGGARQGRPLRAGRPRQDRSGHRRRARRGRPAGVPRRHLLADPRSEPGPPQPAVELDPTAHGRAGGGRVGVLPAAASIRDLLADRACLLVLDDVWRYRARPRLRRGGRALPACSPRPATPACSPRSARRTSSSTCSARTQALALLATWIKSARGCAARGGKDPRPALRLPATRHLSCRRDGARRHRVDRHPGGARSGTTCASSTIPTRAFSPPYASASTLCRKTSGPATSSSPWCRKTCPAGRGRRPALGAHGRPAKTTRCRRLLADLERKGLLYLEGEGEAASVRFHDLQRDFLQLAADDVRTLHAPCWTPMPTLSRPRPRRRTAPGGRCRPTSRTSGISSSDHLVKGRPARASYRHCCSTTTGSSAKLRATDVNALLRDFDPLAGDRPQDLYRERCGFPLTCWRRITPSFPGNSHGRLLQWSDEQSGPCSRGRG